MHIETQIFDDKDNLIHILGYLIAGQRGIKDSFGQQMTEDDPDEVEIESAFINDDEIELTKEQTEEALQALWDEAKTY
jgi:hypothetical protein